VRKAKSESESPFLTPNEVAAILRVSRPTVFRRLADGTIPGIKIGKIWRCRRDQIMVLGDREFPDGEHLSKQKLT